MINLKLNDEEQKVLDEALSLSLSRLGDEISHTDTPEYRDRLKERKELLQEIHRRLH